MIVAGIDFSLTGAGVTVVDDGEISSVNVFSSEPSENRWDRYKNYADMIVKHLKDSEVKLVFIENYIVMAKNINTTTALIEAGAILRLKLCAAKIPFICVAASQLKKYILGKGTGPKELIIKEVYKKYGIDASDNNEADSIVLGMMAKDYHALITSNDINLPKYMTEVLAKIHKDAEKVNINGMLWKKKEPGSN